MGESMQASQVENGLKGDESIEFIDTTRISLAAIDQRLEDASRLLSGYNNAVQGKTQAGNDGSTPE